MQLWLGWQRHKGGEWGACGSRSQATQCRLHLSFGLFSGTSVSRMDQTWKRRRMTCSYDSFTLAQNKLTKKKKKRKSTSPLTITHCSGSVLDETFWSKNTFIHTTAQLHQSSLASKIWLEAEQSSEELPHSQNRADWSGVDQTVSCER